MVIEEILLFSVIGLMLPTGFEDDCYEHIIIIYNNIIIIIIKSAEDNQ